MFRTSDMIMIGVIVAAAAFTYKTKHDAEARVDQIAKLERQIRYEEDTINVLKAEWSSLTQPARLQRLSDQFTADLELKPTEPTQFASVGELPERPLTIEDLTSQSLEDILAETATDPLATGSTAQ